jgi:hypothetical protein
VSLDRRSVTLAGLNLACAAGIGAFCYGLVHLLSIGTCASGNTPFAIVRSCPSGATAAIGPLMGGVSTATLAMVAAGLVTDGGWKPGYVLLFLVTGMVALITALTSRGLGSGSQFAAWTLTATFLPLGLWPLAAPISGYLDHGDQRALSRRGVIADAILSEVRRLQTYPTGEIQIENVYSVQPLTGASFELRQELNILSGRLPARGQRVQVRYDPRHPERFELLGGPAAPARSYR